MKYREPTKNDQEMAEKAFQLMRELALSHPEIEMAAWIGGCMSLLVDRFLDAGVPYHAFCEELECVKKAYKEWWN